jgi:hypothetical protein
VVLAVMGQKAPGSTEPLEVMKMGMELIGLPSPVLVIVLQIQKQGSGQSLRKVECLLWPTDNHAAAAHAWPMPCLTYVGC